MFPLIRDPTFIYALIGVSVISIGFVVALIMERARFAAQLAELAAEKEEIKYELEDLRGAKAQVDAEQQAEQARLRQVNVDACAEIERLGRDYGKLQARYATLTVEREAMSRQVRDNAADARQIAEARLELSARSKNVVSTMNKLKREISVWSKVMDTMCPADIDDPAMRLKLVIQDACDDFLQKEKAPTKKKAKTVVRSSYVPPPLKN